MEIAAAALSEPVFVGKLYRGVGGSRVVQGLEALHAVKPRL